VRLFMIILNKIIAFQLSLFCKNYRFSKTVLYIINRKIHGCLEIPDLFLVLNMISHSWDIMFNTRNKSGISKHPCIILYLFSIIQRIIVPLTQMLCSHVYLALTFKCKYCNRYLYTFITAWLNTNEMLDSFIKHYYTINGKIFL
jgi:hypothetical protein